MLSCFQPGMMTVDKKPVERPTNSCRRIRGHPERKALVKIPLFLTRKMNVSNVDGDDDDGDHLQLRETFLCWLTVRNIEVGEREGRHANSPSLTWISVPDHKSADS